MSAVDDVARMLTLVPWALERPGASVSEMAEAFDVDERTIRRDLEHLDFCGLPGLGGGDLFEVTIVGDRVVVRMADELKRPLRLTPREALRLVLTVDAVADTFGDDLPALRSAIDKVRAAAGVPGGVAVQMDADGERWHPAVRDALAARRQLRLHYRGRGDEEPVERLVDPWALHVADGAWYLQGRDHGVDDLRTFRLDRVAALEVTDDEIASEPPTTPLPEPRYVPGPDDVAVELVLAPGGRWLVAAIEPETSVELEDGRLRIRFHTDALRWIERLLLIAGGEVEVVEPGALATAVRDLAARALARYRGTGAAARGD